MRERLKLVRLDYEFRRVRVVFLKDHPRLPTPSGFIDVRRGDELELPRWQARLLRDAGFVDVRESPVELDFINVHHYKERKSSTASQLTQVPQDFYVKASELIERLEKLIKESPSHMLYRDREAAERNFMDIAETRLAKILRLSYSGGEEFRDRMTAEERVAYNHIIEAIESWREYIKNLTTGVR